MLKGYELRVYPPGEGSGNDCANESSGWSRSISSRLPPAAISVPEGENVALLMTRSKSRHFRMTVPFSTSINRTVRSLLADTSHFPSGE
jgi:hypothetical protein